MVRTPSAGHEVPRWTLVTALLLTLSVAAGLRLIRLPHLPLGLHYDEAANGILAAEIAHGVDAPIFIPSYTGKEVLFFYWAAAWMRVLGATPLALRLTSTLIGLCTVGAAAWSAYELLHHRQDRIWIGVLSAALLTTSFWHVLLSRLGFRAITQPLLQALTVAALWRGLRLEHRGWLTLGGLLCGATAYTYLAARAFPIPLATALLAGLADDWSHRRQRITQFLIFIVAAALALAPLAIFFARHPHMLTTRMGQVASQSWRQAGQGLRACLGMFFLKGDPYIRFNLPGQPLFDSITAALFLLGMVLLFVPWPRLTRPSGRGLRSASRAFLLSTLLVMILPSALATGEITPSNLRTVGLLPFIYIFPALTLSTAFHTASLPSRPDHLRHLLPVILVVLTLVLTALPTTQAYFDRWATAPGLYQAADGDLADVAAYLNRQDLTNVVPYVASLHYRHPTLAFLAQDYPAIKWLREGETLVIPPQHEGLLVLPQSADGGREWIAERLEEEPVASPTGPNGRPAFRAYRIQAGTPISPSQPLTANFAHAAIVLGYDVLGTPRSGGQMDAIIYWRVENRPQPGDLTPILTLTDQWGNVWGQTRPFHYPAEQWDPGELVLDHLSVKVDPGAPPGDYRLLLSFYAESTDTSLPVLDAEGAYAGTALEFPVALERATNPPRLRDLDIEQRHDLATDADLTLLGHSLTTDALRPGERARVTVFWRADRAPESNSTVRLRLGQSTLYEGPPVHGTYPTGQWAAGEVIVDHYDPRLARDMEPGTYTLWLELLDPEGYVLLEPVPLGEITVEAMERVFEPPPSAQPEGTSLGDRVELAAYQLDPPSPSPGEPITLTLYWRALAEMDTAYTAFVHLLGPQGQIAAQHDAIPANGTYPTPLWLPDEVVGDPHTLDLPPDLTPGTYTLEIGMYVAETGERLPVPGSTDDAVHLQMTLESD